MILFGCVLYIVCLLFHYIYKLKNWRDTYIKLGRISKNTMISIPEIKKKYNQLKEAQSRKDMCTCCFKCKDDLTSPLRHTKKGMICKDCQKDEQIRYYDYTEEDMDNMRQSTQTTRLYKGKRVTAKTKRNYV